jgi:putative hydrolase of the HAD superfamily
MQPGGRETVAHEAKGRMMGPDSFQVIFDLGGVLLTWNPDDILTQVFPDPVLKADVTREVFRNPDWAEYDRGTLHESELMRRYHLRTGRPASEMQKITELVRGSLIPVPDSWNLVRDLAARGISLYCVSNMPAATFTCLKSRYDGWGVFRGIVISGEVGLLKPERAIFEYVRDRYGLTPSTTAFIDDHAPNIAAAESVGFRGILFRGADDCRRRLEAIFGSLGAAVDT